MIRTAGILIVITSSALTVPARSSPRVLDRPNIVVIVTDDQRADTLAWMPIVQQRLVSRGVMFENAMVPTSVCCPSRASILTGLYSHSTGVWSNADGWRGFNANGMEDRTIASWLDPSYRTILVGKYLNGYDKAPLGHVPPGWNAWHVFHMANANYYDYELVHTDGSITTYGDRWADYSTDVLRSFAIDEIKQTPAEEPLFLYFAPYAPHGPSDPAPRHSNLEPHLEEYRPPSFNETDVEDKPPWIRDLSLVDPIKLDALRKVQYRSLQAVDQAVGSIFNALRAAGRMRDTLVLFMSDNGISWGEHRIPITNKFMPYDAATRVPFAIRWDTMVPPGTIDRRLALNVDIAATIAQAAGVTPPSLEGLPLLGERHRVGTVVEAARNPGPGGNGLLISRPAYCGFRTKGYLFVHYASGEEELYAYRTDPWELENRIGDPDLDDVAKRLRTRAMTSCAPPPPEFSW